MGLQYAILPILNAQPWTPKIVIPQWVDYIGTLPSVEGMQFVLTELDTQLDQAVNYPVTHTPWPLIKESSSIEK